MFVYSNSVLVPCCLPVFPKEANTAKLISNWPLVYRVSSTLTDVFFFSFTLSHCHVMMPLSQFVAVSNPKQVQLIHGKNASTPTSPTSSTTTAAPAQGTATDKGKTLLAANPEGGKDVFNMKP